MDYKIIDYKDASVQMASFEGKEGCGEYHLLAHVPPEGSFQQQLEQLHTALDKAIEDECKGAAPVFIRYFLSDVSNQAEILYNSLGERATAFAFQIRRIRKYFRFPGSFSKRFQRSRRPRAGPYIPRRLSQTQGRERRGVSVRNRGFRIRR